MIRKLSAALLVGLAAAMGCSQSGDNSPKAIVKGKLVDGGKPYTAAPPRGKAALPPPPGTEGTNSALQIQFTPVEGGDTFMGPVAADTGAFEISGHDGKGIKPGKYKVILTMPNAVPGISGAPEVLGGRFSREKSQIEREVTVDGPEIVIDVSKPKG